jgi:response regulator RpfG family c-di-GMP phosphodiesterase
MSLACFLVVTEYETSSQWVREREAIMRSILIIDDQPHMRELIPEELRDMGCEVQSVGNVQSVRRCFT